MNRVPEIDLFQGGYSGDVIEDLYKPFTGLNMEYWWHFREVLRSGQFKGHPYWRRKDNAPLEESDWENLIALSLTHYAVYTGIAEAIAFFEILSYELNRTTFPPIRLHEVSRNWKAMYSSLYSSFTAFSNVVCIVVGQKDIFKSSNKSRNYDPGDAKAILKSTNELALIQVFESCLTSLEIRNQLDHYWLIYRDIDLGRFNIDEDFKKKGHLVTDRSQIKVTINAYEKASVDLMDCMKSFNIIYKAIAKEDGYLDRYLKVKGYAIDYSDYGPPHNGKRPQP